MRAGNHESTNIFKGSFILCDPNCPKGGTSTVALKSFDIVREKVAFKEEGEKIISRARKRFFLLNLCVFAFDVIILKMSFYPLVSLNQMQFMCLKCLTCLLTWLLYWLLYFFATDSIFPSHKM